MLIQRNLSILFCLTATAVGAQSIEAADFSHAQQIYVPPSLIHRDLDALGTNNWNLPSASANSGAASASTNPIDSLLSSFGSGSSAGADTGGLTAAPTNGINWGSAKDDVLNTSQYIPGVNKITARINTLLSNGKVAEAENLARSGLKYFPSSSILKSKFTAITTGEAQTFLASGYGDLAGKKAREALACNPNAKTAKIVEGKVLQAQGLNPNTAEGHVQSGDSLSADGRLLEAGVEYKLALNIKPTAPAQVGLGNLALGKGSVIDAGRHYEQALAIDPQSAAAHRQRGALRYISQDTVGANSDFSKAVALDPNDRLSSDALVSLWKQQVANNPGVNSHLGLARAYMQTNNLDAAKGEYKTVASLDPNNPALPEARRSFKLALAKQQANQNLQAAKTLTDQGAYSEAQQKLDEGLVLSPGDPQILLLRGQVSEKLGMYEQAHASYMSVLKTDPINVEAAQRLKSLAAPENSNQISAPLSTPAPAAPFLAQPSQFPPIAPVPSMPTIQVIPNTPGNAPVSPDIFTAPLKSPLPTTKSQNNNSTVRIGSDTYEYDEVGNLANFLCAVRILMLAEKQSIQ